MSATFFAITSPAPWATTLDRLAAAELPRTDWSSLEPLGETGRYRFAPPPTPGRSSPQRQRTHCPKGHPYDEANTYVTPRGWRQCRTCNRAHYRAYYNRHYRATGPRRVAPPEPPEPPPPPRRAPREARPPVAAPPPRRVNEREGRPGAVQCAVVRSTGAADDTLARAKARIAARRERLKGVA
jgi:hypothetical protein